MTAKRWFDDGGQIAELQRIGTLKNSDQRKAALLDFNERNNAFLAEKLGPSVPGTARESQDASRDRIRH